MIEADTSKYTDPADRILALAECIKAKRAGKAVQSRYRSGSWQDDRWDCNTVASQIDYRVKPEPVVTQDQVYSVYVQGLEHPVRVGMERTAALDEARHWGGAVRLEAHYRALHGGVVVKDEVRNA